MTFKEIVDHVLADRFGPAKRIDAKKWVNHRYWWLWTLEDWTFKWATVTFPIAAGFQQTAGSVTDLKTPVAVYLANGDPLEPIADHRAFFDRYASTASVEKGTPEAFTMVGGALLLGPTPVASETGTIIYEREYTELVDDNSVPALPSGSHLALVHGGASEGLRLENDPSWQDSEDSFQATVAVLRQGYLQPIHQPGEQMPAYRPGW